MRQVPYGIIGNGRLARHMMHYLTLLGIPTRQWTRASTQPPHTALRDCYPILVLISDDAIAPFIEAHPELLRTHLRHCCASLTLPTVASAHPLMTFGPTLYDESHYRSIPFIIEDHGPRFDELLPGLPNPHSRLDANDKALYHSLCVMSGNFSVILWQKARRAFAERLNLPPEYLTPYCQQIAANLLLDPDRCLTGPLARGDRHTIQRHIDALQNDAFQRVYRAMVTAFDEEFLA